MGICLSYFIFPQSFTAVQYLLHLHMLQFYLDFIFIKYQKL